MAVDTPAKIAIIGAGPIGLEAALYARFLGYDVEIFGFQQICGSVLRKRSLLMPTPFGQNCSSLALAALAMDENYRPPPSDAYLTYGQWFDQYLKPLSETDLIADHIRLQTVVAQIGKVELAKTDQPTGEYDRGNWDFRLHHQRIDACGADGLSIADVVLDCGGLVPLPLGHGGIPAIGESRLFPNSELVLSGHGEKSVLVVGEDFTAAQVVLGLLEQSPAAKIAWATRHEREDRSTGPLLIAENDPLPQRRQVLEAANVAAVSGRLNWLPGMWIEKVVKTEEKIDVQFSGAQEHSQCFDYVFNRTGYRPDWSLASELQLDLCPITDAPRPLANYLLQSASPYLIDYPAPDAAAMITSEPNYYVLGAKSFGRRSGFLYEYGLRQIRDVFTIIGDRSTLDLYAQMAAQ